MSNDRNQPAGPLAGLRVIELGTLLAGPFCGQLMGDLGAEIIKVEAPRVGDPMRQWGQEKAHGKSLQSQQNSTPLALTQSRVAHPSGERWW